MYSQFSDVRFSSVAFAAQSVSLLVPQPLVIWSEITNDIVESVLLSSKHRLQGAEQAALERLLMEEDGDLIATTKLPQ